MSPSRKDRPALANAVSRRSAGTPRGFTLVELVSVLVILGALAAMALPRLVDLVNSARVARVQQMAVDLRTVAETVRMACMVKLSNCGSINAQNFVLNGRTIWVNYGYPDAGDALGTKQIDTLMNTAGWSLSLPSGATKFSLSSAPDPANCAVQYNDAYHGGGSITITAITSGC